jgi:hypothetical protein
MKKKWNGIVKVDGNFQKRKMRAQITLPVE